MGNSGQNQSSSTKNISQADVIDLGKLFALLVDSRWLIIVLTSFFAVVSIAYALLATPVYKADALLQVESKSSGMSLLEGDMFSSDSTVAAEVEIIKSPMTLGKTVDKFNLTTQITANYLPFIGKGLARLQGKRQVAEVSRFELPAHIDVPEFTLVVDDGQRGAYSVYDSFERKVLSGVVGELVEQNDYRLFVQNIDAPSGVEFTLRKCSKSDAIIWLQENLAVSEKGKKNGILTLSFSGEDKYKIEVILNDISKNYFLQNMQRNSAEAEQSLELLQGHLPDIKVKLNSSEDILNAFRQANESIDFGLEAQSKLKVLVELEAQLNELTFKESYISQRFTKDHPAYKSLLDKRQVLLTEKQQLNKQIQALPKTQREVLRMTRDMEVNQQIYIQLLTKVQELSILKAGTAGNVRILDVAQSYSKPIKPKKPLIVVLAILFGGMLAVAVVLLRETFHKGVETPDEIEELGLPVYASIAKSDWQINMDLKTKGHKHRKHYNLHEVLLAESNPADLSIEALRSLRTSLHFAMMEAKNNVVMISGPASGIGKSFVSANFAAVIAKAGQKVLIVDGDMRKGYLQHHFGLKWENGLSDMLSGKLTTQEVLKETAVDNLYVITRGQIPPNPSELLMHPRFAEFVEWASGEYDLVLIDTPPILAVTDPSIVGPLVGTTLMVGRFGQNTVKEIGVAKDRFERAGIEVKGFILNAVEKKACSTYAYYNYSYK